MNRFGDKIEAALAKLSSFGAADGVTLLRDEESYSDLRSMAISHGDTVLPAWGATAEPSADGFTLVMSENGQAIGQMSISIEHNEDWTNPTLEAVFVDEAYRGTGVARRLADAAVSLLTEAVIAAEAETPGVHDYFDPYFTGDTNEGGDAIMSRMSGNLEANLERISGETPEPG